MKKFFWLFLAMCVSTVFISCDETSEEDEYANWKERCQHVIDSIAEVAEANEDGKWHIYKSFRLPEDDPDDLSAVKNVNNYVYCHVEEAGLGTESPIYTDTVRVNYRGWHINNTVFDQSFKGPFDPSVTVPYKTSLDNVITGWTTALQYMVEGDVWTVYIPYTLAYGSEDYGGVRGYSTLKFLMNLVAIYPTGTLVPDWQ